MKPRYILFIILTLSMVAASCDKPSTTPPQDTSANSNQGQQNNNNIPAPANDTPTSTLKSGQKISVQGSYVKNTTDSELQPGVTDGASYQVIDTKQYGQIKIVIGRFRIPCLAKEIYQPSKGDLVEVYGEVLSSDTMSVCLSEQYYIKNTRSTAHVGSLKIGEEVAVQGRVVDNHKKNIEVDAPAYLIVSTQSYGIVNVYYLAETFANPCNATDIGLKIKPGETISAYGQAISNNSIEVCNSNRYYLRN